MRPLIFVPYPTNTYPQKGTPMETETLVYTGKAGRVVLVDGGHYEVFDAYDGADHYLGRFSSQREATRTVERTEMDRTNASKG